MVQFDEERQEEKIDRLHKKEEEEYASSLANENSLPYTDLTVNPINIDALRAVKEEVAREAMVAPFDLKDKHVSLGILTPLDEKTNAVIADLRTRGYIPEPYIVSHASLNRVWERYKDLSYSFETRSGALDISNEEIVEIVSHVKKLADIEREIANVVHQKKAYRISRILEIILAGGIALKASDIHLEPQDKDVRLRYRLDGVLTDVLNFDRETYDLLLSRVKLVSNLKLNIKEKAQDGRFSIILSDMSVEVRVSLLPEPTGESMVLRILSPESINITLETHDIEPKLLAVIKKQIRKPNGMILMTGPTGSGKTTTLYAILREIYSPDVKIITIENPIEYHLKGIVQTQTNDEEGYTFAEGLRSALRQDPDVIMVGEIRDSETATTAINASLTGHLVLSTLHTNNAAGTFPRLLDLGVNPKVVSSAVSISIAQRLARKLCENCKKEVALESEDKAFVEKVLDGIVDKTNTANIQKENVYQPVGCDECNETGFKGRLGVYEAVLVDGEIEKAIIQNPSERDIATAAKPQGILNLAEDGVIKVLRGETSLEELGRVVDLSQY